MYQSRLTSLEWNVCVALPYFAIFAMALFGTATAGFAENPTGEQAIADEFQIRSDSEQFAEYLKRNGPEPDKFVIGRVVERANSRSTKDVDALFDAALSDISRLFPPKSIDRMDCLRKASARQHSGAQALLAMELLTLSSSRSENKEGLDLLAQVEASNDPTALYTAGILYSKGLPALPKDLQKSRRLLERSLDGGCESAAFTLSKVFEQEGDHEKALQFCLRAAANGDIAALKTLYNDVTQGVPHQNAKKAIEFLQRGSLWGDGEMMYLYATQINGHELGLIADPPLAKQLMIRAARRGVQSA